MKYKITAPQQATGSICLPASKSISNRALIIHALTDSPLPVQNVSDSDDTNAMLRALTFQSPLIDVGAAGTSMRFLTALLSAKKGEWTITGSERMKNRPIKLLVDALNSLGADICYIEKEGFPPLKIKGAELEGGEIELDGGVSSQYISALLMIAPLMKKGLSLTLKGRIISEPYIHLTLTMMSQFGIRYSRKENTIYILPQVYKPAPFTVESDWSGASYWFEILSLLASGEFVLEGLHQNSAQGDARVATIFSQLGIETIYRDNAISIKKKEPLVRK